MNKTTQVQNEMFAAMKSKDAERKESLSLLLARLKGAAKDKRADLTEEEENTIIVKEIKETKESIEKAGGRQDIIDKNERRLVVLEEFAPKFLDDSEIKREIEAVLAELGLDAPTGREKGNIMKLLMPRVKGRADGKRVNELLAEYMAKEQ